jgi:uncharacterized protein YbjQ (UPF0145 family)
MLVTTTPSIEGRKITKYCGVVAGEPILGANVFKERELQRALTSTTRSSATATAC